jgi:CheY-like chemotaxis protein
MAKILVVDDERDIRDIITVCLRGLGGFDVVQAVNGAEAVERAVAEQPDLILMDVRMPKMSGYEACAKLKSMDLTRGIPVIFLSAKAQDADIQQGLAAGASKYLPKPFAPVELVNEVHDTLRQMVGTR